MGGVAVGKACRSGWGMALVLLAAGTTVPWATAVAAPGEERAIVAYPQAEAGGAARLMERVRQRGQVRLIVGLAQPLQDESRLSTADAAAQRQQLAAAQDGLLRRIRSAAGGSPPVAFRTIPFLTLDADEPALQRLLADGMVASVQEDVPVPPLLRQSVPLVRADAVARQGYAGTGHAVAVLDTGVDAAHPMLRGKVVAEACYSSRVSGIATPLCPGSATVSTAPGSGRPCPASISGCFHGTHVAGIAAGATPTLSGVARGASLISIQVFTRFDTSQSCAPQPAPCLLSYTSDQLRALEHVHALSATRRIAAVNMSLGGGLFAGPCDAQNPAMTAAIERLRSAGIATVIAAGNAGRDGLVSAPGCITAAVTVGSTTKADAMSSFSNLGPQVDLLAPGSAITSAAPGRRYVVASGTSMAAPHVAGAFAMLRSANPAAGLDQILAALQASPALIGRNGLTRPRIDLVAALAQARRGTLRRRPAGGATTGGAGS